MNERNAKIMSMVDQGMTYAQIAGALQMTRSAVAGVVDRARHPYEKRGVAKGVKQAGAKLNDEKVRAIRAMRAQGDGIEFVAATFGISPSVISRITSGKAWSHVE